jgi:hypothetical protein
MELTGRDKDRAVAVLRRNLARSRDATVVSLFLSMCCGLQVNVSEVRPDRRPSKHLGGTRRLVASISDRASLPRLASWSTASTPHANPCAAPDLSGRGERGVGQPRAALGGKLAVCRLDRPQPPEGRVQGGLSNETGERRSCEDGDQRRSGSAASTESCPPSFMWAANPLSQMYDRGAGATKCEGVVASADPSPTP